MTLAKWMDSVYELCDQEFAGSLHELSDAFLLEAYEAGLTADDFSEWYSARRLIPARVVRASPPQGAVFTRSRRRRDRVPIRSRLQAE
jgi:hypothetical protein